MKKGNPAPVLPGMFSSEEPVSAKADSDGAAADRETKTIEIYHASRGAGVCRGCKRSIVWALVVKSGAKMCFNIPLPVRRSFLEPDTQRRIDVVDLGANHWASCPNREQFKRRPH